MIILTTDKIERLLSALDRIGWDMDKCIAFLSMLPRKKHCFTCRSWPMSDLCSVCKEDYSEWGK